MTESEKTDLILEKLNDIDKRLDGVDKRLDSVETDIRSMKLQLENEISRNIKIVAEGHLDLSRNLHEAMKPSNTLEMLQVQVNMLESKVRELERKAIA